MPILNSRAAIQTETPDGTTVDVPPREALLLRGPRLEVMVSIRPRVGQQLLQQGAMTPAPITGTALIDTGAMMTCIDDAVAKSMGLPVVDVLNMISASHSAIPQNVYPIRVEAVGIDIEFDVTRAMGSIIGMQGVVLLLGRDALRNCTLFYNGTIGQFSLSQ